MNERKLKLYSERRIAKARQGLLAFTKFTKPDYQINWHHKLTCKYLNKFIKGEIKRLMIFEPPRFGKSELVSRRLPAFLFGLNPKTSIIATSYSADLASRMNRDVQRIIDDERYKTLFPHVRLKGINASDDKWIRNNDIFEIVDHGGIYKCAGVGGGITGLGGEWLILDDVIKNQEEADSIVYREKVFEWYQSTLETRLEGDGGILITVTRWHEDDLAGRLLKLAQDNQTTKQWTVLSLPAILEEKNNPEDPREIGEALWPAKFPLENHLETKQKALRTFTALYQQRPQALEGGIIKKSWIKFYRKAELPGEFSRIIQSWDLTFKDANTSDFVVGQIWGVHNGKKYLIDQMRGQMGFTESCRAITILSARFPQAIRKLIEEKANGAAVIETLKRNGISGIIPITPKESKYARLSAVSTQFEAGDVYYPDPSVASWITTNLDEILTFPNGAHDDTVDATSQALNDLAKVSELVPRISVL